MNCIHFTKMLVLMVSLGSASVQGAGDSYCGEPEPRGMRHQLPPLSTDFDGLHLTHQEQKEFNERANRLVAVSQFFIKNGFSVFCTPRSVRLMCSDAQRIIEIEHSPAVCDQIELSAIYEIKALFEVLKQCRCLQELVEGKEVLFGMLTDEALDSLQEK